MKIVVMSDTHGCNNMIEYVLSEEKDADLYLHCGDICVDKMAYPELITVCGNNDYYDYPMQRMINLCNHKLIMFHSHQFSFLNRKQHMVQAAQKNDCDIICYGHTHIALYEIIDGVHVLNPGSLYSSRDGRGISYAIITIDDTVSVQIKFLEDEISR